jgi:hypothetical protein
MKRFKIYRNLHKQTFSIQGFVPEKKGYRVTERADTMLLSDVKFKVMETGRRKVLNEKRKNVHAFITPLKYNVLQNDKTLDEMKDVLNLVKVREIYYNPYKFSSFVYKDTEESLDVKSLEKVLMINNKVYEIK